MPEPTDHVAQLAAALPANPANDGPIGVHSGTLRAVLDRLQAAEDVCVVFGWTAARFGSDRDKALHELWASWLQIVGNDHGSRRSHPHLTDEYLAQLAEQRDATRKRTLAAMKAAEAPAEAE